MRLAVIGTGAGLFSGLFGVGGGTVIVPLLVLWLGYGTREATGTSLGAIVLIAAAAMLAQGAYGNVHVGDGVLVGVPAVGGVLARDVAAAARRPARRVAAVRGAAGGHRDQPVDPMTEGALIVGFAAGVVAGMLGVGGGILFVPALVLFLGLAQVDAEATSLLAIIPVALVGAARQERYGNLRLRDAIVFGHAGDPGGDRRRGDRQRDPRADGRGALRVVDALRRGSDGAPRAGGAGGGGRRVRPPPPSPLRREPLLVRESRPPLAAGVVAAVLGVAGATALLFGLREIAPVLSLGVVYLLVVLVVSAYWGLWLGIATSLLSALAYNFFHIPPTGRFTIATGENWVALLAFLAVAAAASAVAELARERAVEATQRREEADLAAAAARALLGGARLQDGLAQTAHGIAAALGLPSAQLVLGTVEASERSSTYSLDGGRATLILPAALPTAVEARLRERIVPALESILAGAIEREALLDEVVETAALRRSDDLKTAILRAV